MTSDSITGSFLQTHTIDIEPVLKTDFPHEWMTIVLLLLFFGLSFLWFFASDQIGFARQFRKFFGKTDRTVPKQPALLLSILLYLNFLFTVILLIILLFEHFHLRNIPLHLTGHLTALTATAFVAYSIYRLAIIVLGGFIFKTDKAAREQVKLYIKLDNLTGFLMPVVLLLILFTETDYFFYLGIFILLITNVIKWFRTIRIGISLTGFTIYHLILYLCTLEIIPLLLLIKLIGRLSV